MYTILKTTALLCVSTAVFSGTMGEITKDTSSVPYIGLDASYTWPATFSVANNSSVSVNTKNGWGGRLSIGANKPYNNLFSFNVEFGGGYYGEQKMAISELQTYIRQHYEGYDLLGGMVYHYSPMLRVFGDIGFLALNSRQKSVSDNSLLVSGGVYEGTATAYSNTTQILPELKVGLLYNVYKNLDVNVAYMYAFGQDGIGGSITQRATPSAVISSGTSNLQSPSLSTILFGLRYNFS